MARTAGHGVPDVFEAKTGVVNSEVTEPQVSSSGDVKRVHLAAEAKSADSAPGLLTKAVETQVHGTHSDHDVKDNQGRTMFAIVGRSTESSQQCRGGCRPAAAGGAQCALQYVCIAASSLAAVIMKLQELRPDLGSAALKELEVVVTTASVLVLGAPYQPRSGDQRLLLVSPKRPATGLVASLFPSLPESTTAEVTTADVPLFQLEIVTKQGRYLCVATDFERLVAIGQALVPREVRAQSRQQAMDKAKQWGLLVAPPLDFDHGATTPGQVSRTAIQDFDAVRAAVLSAAGLPGALLTCTPDALEFGRVASGLAVWEQLYACPSACGGDGRRLGTAYFAPMDWERPLRSHEILWPIWDDLPRLTDPVPAAPAELWQRPRDLAHLDLAALEAIVAKFRAST